MGLLRLCVLLLTCVYADAMGSVCYYVYCFFVHLCADKDYKFMEGSSCKRKSLSSGGGAKISLFFITP